MSDTPKQTICAECKYVAPRPGPPSMTWKCSHPQRTFAMGRNPLTGHSRGTHTGSCHPFNWGQCPLWEPSSEEERVALKDQLDQFEKAAMPWWRRILGL